MKHKLEQTAVDAALDQTPSGANPSTVRLGPQLHLSVEHLSIAQMLSDDELDLVVSLGRGLSSKLLAQRYGLTAHGVYYRIDELSKKTRMSRLSLAVLGYALSGQPQYQDLAA